METRSNIFQSSTIDDLISDFFQLVEEKPVVQEEVNVKNESSGYFAETLSWLKEVDSPKSDFSLSIIYEIQDRAIAQQLLCLCSQHQSTATTFTAFSESYNSTFTPALQSFVGAESHAGHKHCDCGGHYKDGRCDSCGTLEHND